MNVFLQAQPVFSDDKIVFGILMFCLAIVFYTSNIKKGWWPKFYKYVPALLMCYLLPAILNSTGIISAKETDTYVMAKNYLLPVSLILLTLSIDLKAISQLGFKSLIMFFTATIGIIIGGPVALLLMAKLWPATVDGLGVDAVWRGLSTLAGSWIGGGANQAAMLEVYQYNPDKYGGMVLIDIVVANIWMAVLLLGIGQNAKIDKWLKADSSAIEKLKEKVSSFSESIKKEPKLKDYIIILGVGFFLTSLAHFFSTHLVSLFESLDSLKDSSLTSGFFWVIVLATTFGLVLSFTKAKNLEGYGASKIGSVFIYILVATIGVKMDITKVAENPGLIVLGLVWMAFHVLLLLIVAKIIRAPFFFLAVGSKANIGGAASAPVIAAAFHPALAPVGVLLAVLGYAIGTYGAVFCAILMELASKYQGIIP